MEKTALKYILIIFGSAALILTIVFILDLYIMQTSVQPYIISFEGKSIFRDGDFTALKAVRPNGSEYILLYGINQNSTLLTELVDENGKKIGSRTLSHILIDGNSTFQISIHNVGAGSFSGYIIAKKADKGFISIPLTLATRPLIREAIILVTIGVCISVCVWEIILQYRDSQKEHENLNIQSTIADKRKKINDIISIAVLKLIRVQETKYLSSHGIVQPKDLDRIPVDEHAADYYLKDADTKRIKSQILQEHLAQNAKHVQKRKDKNNAPIKSAVRAALLELAPLLFGIFIAMFAILNDQLVIGASVLAPLAIAKLIGIGLATGSLKQLIDK